MGSDARSPSSPASVTLTYSDGLYVAEDDGTGIASQGETKAEALENLAEALRLHSEAVPDDGGDDLEPATAPWFDGQ